MALCLFSGSPSAAPADIFVVTGGSDVHSRILEAAQSTLDAGDVEAHLREVSVETLDAALEASPRPALVVTLGTEAAHGLHVTLGVPVLHAAIPASIYPHLLGSEEPSRHPHGHSALFLDQPARRQIAAVEIALPQLQRLGVLATSPRAALLEPIADAAQRAGIELLEDLVPDEGLLVPRVERLLRHADALLITPDPEIYNRFTLRKVLLAAYRQRKPVIGLSSAYVRAGALLAVHAEPKLIGQDLGHSLVEFLATGRLHPPSHARLYEISVNHHVARSLGLNLPEEAVLLEALHDRENLQ